MEFLKSSSSPLKFIAVLPLLAAALAFPAQSAVLLDGAATWPTLPAFQTVSPTQINTERDTGVNRDAGQTFTLSSSFQLDAIYVPYQASSPYGDGTFNLRIYPIAAGDVNADNIPPAPSGADVLNVAVTLDAATRAAANFTTATTTTSFLEFDLIGTDEVFLTPGTYAFQFQEDAATTRFFSWQARSSGNLYTGGRQFDNLDNFSTNHDGILAFTAVPEPGTFAMLLGGTGMLMMRRRRAASCR